MSLHLTEKELRVITWALVHWSVKVENTMKTVPEKDIWDLYEEELNITEQLIIRIKNEESNKRKD